ncbi:TPA: hypothetical protein N0F65_001075 [Lagenidium giganteum]|uniref:PDZ domain-containing protein n=1 Tax=Lagenidium giganteum TaxID=4803 RepID=A0AAV2YJV4_9STRA|nr:TPA: hypothetical protein N0F65_001075 [Lagenidium giganteum]
MEYEVLWGDGPLGLTLRPDLGEDMPPVVGRITRLDSAAALAKVAVGHMLVSINGMDTARQGYDHVVGTLQKIPRPATLRFRVPRAFTSAPSSVGKLTSSASFREPRDRDRSKAQRSSNVSSISDPGGRSMKREQYTVVWTEGPLGMILRPDDEDCHVPCIRKITGKGAGTGMERAAVGDVLVAVNGQETKSLGFRSTIALLKSIRKPAVLKFKRMHRRLSRKRSSVEDASPSRSGPIKDIGVYDIVWREGELGLKLKPGDRDIPVISRLTGKGTASGLHNANVGDELMSVNGSTVEGSAYQDTLRMLKHTPKPAVLRFRPSKDRRESIMSVRSIRSNPATSSEVDHVRSRHVPMYDSGRTRRSPSGERKKKKRIPLEVAKELVAASLGVELERAVFAGMRIVDIQDGTREAHLLRVEAKHCIMSQGGDSGRGGGNLQPKEALTRAEQEAKVLQEALEKVKNQAKKYEQILAEQNRERVLASAIRTKSEEVINKQNNVISELSGVIAGLKRDSYSEYDIPSVKTKEEDEDERRLELMNSLQGVMNIPVVVPDLKYCADCGATEKESKLDMDDDGEVYCADCWEKWGTRPPVAPAALQSTAAPTPASDSTSATAGSTRLTRLNSEDRQREEMNARMEAEQKLMELKELRRSGSVRSVDRQSSVNPADRSDRERRGLEELAQALKEEEDRARAEGNAGLAKKLSLQRARTMADANGDDKSSPLNTMGELMSSGGESEFGHFYGRGRNTAVQVSSPKSDVAPSDTTFMAPPVSLKRAVTEDSPFAPPPAPASTNDYGDVNSEDEADDQVEMNDDDDELREAEDRNFALARQLEEAHNVIERARMSIMLSGDDANEDDSAGLSSEQISLFKKLTSQAEERASMVDRLHPMDDDSDSEGEEDEEGDDGVWI